MRVEAIPDEVLAEARLFNRAFFDAAAAGPPLWATPPATARENRRVGGGLFPPPTLLPQAVNRRVDALGRAVQVRLLVPESPSGVYLFFHGGGWVLGSADVQDPLLWRFAQEAGVAVISVDYALAPERPYPAAADDCETAACWLLENAAAEFGTDAVVVGGESAGAHLAVTTLVRLRDRGALRSISAANLVYGLFDLSMTPSQRLRCPTDPFLSKQTMEWLFECFVPGRSPEDRRDPHISPLYAELGGMPKALFTAGLADPLIDDSLFMAARWEAAGAKAELVIYPEAIHGFTIFPTALADIANRRQIDFVRGSTRLE